MSFVRLGDHSSNVDYWWFWECYRVFLFPASPRLPIELCEYIIDWVSAARNPLDYHDKEPQETLHACILVCRAWQNRARMYLFTRVNLSSTYLPTLCRTLRNERHLSSFINGLVIRCHQRTPISSLFISQRLQRLQSLSLYRLDLAREHSLLPGSLLSYSVKELYLWELQGRRVSQLIRFINSFHSLDNLLIHFASSSLEYSGQILPKPGRISSHSLRLLKLDLVPGVSRLINWFLGAGPFLACLKTLCLTCRGFRDNSRFRSCFGGVGELLHRCSATIEILSLGIGDVPLVNEISDLCKFMACCVHGLG